MQIAVIGASGGAVARDAISRGHEVTATGRDPEKLAALEGMALRLQVDAPRSFDTR